MTKLSLKQELDNLREKFETVDFIKDDPVQFPHLFKSDPKNLELMAFIASIFAFGKREAFISKLNLLLEIMKFDPYNFILNFDKNEEKLNGFIYRFYKDEDIKSLFYVLSEIIKTKKSLGNFFFENKDKDTRKLLQNIYDEIYNSKFFIKTQGFLFMISNPRKNGANKRMNMFLRWMTRKPPVDFGIWDFLDTKDLIIPLDVHVSNTARQLGLLDRKQNDYISAWSLTQKLKEFDPVDPVKYDFALFGAGVNKENLHVLYK